MSVANGRVEMWRGGVRKNISVAAPFVWRCLNGSTMAPFPHPPGPDELALYCCQAIADHFCAQG